MRAFSFFNIDSLIQRGDALVKTICSPVGDGRSWDDIISKLKGAAPTPTTLLPTNGKIALFEPDNPALKIMVGLMFDLRKCHVEYVFEEDASSKKWLDQKDIAPQNQITIEILKGILGHAVSRDVILKYNEVLASVSEDALVGVFATEDTLLSRLNALAKRYLIKKSLGKSVEIFILTREKGKINYEKYEMIEDVRKAFSKDSSEPERVLVNQYIDESLLEEAGLVPNSNELETYYLDEEKPFNTHKNFLNNENVPKPLKNIILGYLGFLGVARLSFDVVDHPVDKAMQDLMVKKFHEMRLQDLESWQAEVPLSLSQNSIDQMIYVRKDDLFLIERAIIHFGQLDTKKDSAFRHSSYELKYIFMFLKYGSLFNIIKIKKLVVYIEGEEYSFSSYTPSTYVDLENFSVLVEAVLHGNASIARLVLERYPAHISDVMDALDNLEKISKKYKENCHYSAEQVSRAKINILLQLKPNHPYTPKASDKRLVEEYLLDKVNKVKTKRALFEFYQKHTRAVYLNQHRHGIYDSISGAFFPAIKKNILLALSEKAKSLGGDEKLLSVEDEKLNLDKSLLALKQILESKRDKLLEEKQSGSIFYSSSRTHSKLQVINEVIEKLKTITHFSELKMFSEMLLMNDGLTQRRSIGLGMSDTGEQLKGFCLSLKANE